MCFTSYAVGPTFYLYYGSGRVAFGVASVLVYVLLMVVFTRRQTSTPVLSVSQHDQLGRQREFTHSLGICCLFTLLLFVIPLTVGNTANMLGLRANHPAVSVPLWGYILSNLNPLANLAVYLVRHREIKVGGRKGRRRRRAEFRKDSYLLRHDSELLCVVPCYSMTVWHIELVHCWLVIYRSQSTGIR